jgi:hypothetical protein
LYAQVVPDRLAEVALMSGQLLPPWIPEWNGAEAIAAEINREELRSTVGRLVDLVLTDDTVVLDSLSTALESAVITPLSTLASVYESEGKLTELVVAARLVRRSASPYMKDAPQEFRSLVEKLPE